MGRCTSRDGRADADKEEERDAGNNEAKRVVNRSGVELCSKRCAQQDRLYPSKREAVLLNLSEDWEKVG